MNWAPLTDVIYGIRDNNQALRRGLGGRPEGGTIESRTADPMARETSREGESIRALGHEECGHEADRSG